LNLPSNRYAPSKIIAPIVYIDISGCWWALPTRDEIRAFAFGGAAYLSLGLRRPPAKLELAVFAVFAFVGAILLGAF
jgi:hypothetical protein